MPLTFASWNINSIRVRAHLVKDWLDRHQDCQLLGLQEIKCEATQFPKLFEEEGLHTAVVGQKSYNGVAFISRAPLTITTDHLPGFDDPAARYIECELNGVVIGNLYLPNGNSGGDAGFQTKLAFFDALYKRAQSLRAAGKPFALMGDYNLCPTDQDFAPGALSPDDALVRPESRAAFHRLLWSGLTDAVKIDHPTTHLYTFWDYQAGAFQRNAGLRIDHALLSPTLADRFLKSTIDRDERGQERPSDHVPLMVTIKN
ncbi:MULTISPECIES: exodeoxyribonuclease III [unclassified Saccharibacter]|uniref:exodeoxyribonuclease III n=1 Tax=unclassified Saccharibacter TaxID=2648722 RepID=UPI0013266E74|nr:MULTISPECIES: exodeoxyribonuclease III [unclassified Saccharibacter]MXV36085.1 exodeoxyribonuclease III [Saccharibacter sp. EH611]MXV56944.1 exodeoxyribonuclease III [Saccharibacter sp. EH70]MXV66696.1 exodeoxyribonuclease III [Saccharibacter sp. EH60]